jgi:hypothetical protein
MYKDIIHYKLAKGITKENLLEVALEVHDKWMKNQEGFIKWEINTNKQGGLTDIVFWESEAAAKKAEQDMGNIANAEDWFECYEEGSITSNSTTLLKGF